MTNPFLYSNHTNSKNKVHLFGTIIFLIVLVLITQLPVKAYSSGISASQLILLANNDRAEYGERALTENTLLDNAAQQKAQDMLSQNYFDHFSPSGVSPWDYILSNGYDYGIAGENLAMDFATSNGVNSAWLESPSHARNILNPNFTDIGMAVIDGNLDNHQTTIVVQLFGSSRQTALQSILSLPIVQTVSHWLNINSF